MPQTTEEHWLPVVGYEGRYEISDQGRVRSLDQKVPNRHGMRIARGRMLSLYFGDRYVKVRLKQGDRGRTWNVHQLLAEAFIGPRPDGTEVCHNNGVHHDNRVENIRYDTHSENQIDQVRHGLNPWAARTHCQRDHEYTPENTIIRPSSTIAKSNGRTRRICRICNTERRRLKAG